MAIPTANEILNEENKFARMPNFNLFTSRRKKYWKLCKLDSSFCENKTFFVIQAILEY